MAKIETTTKAFKEGVALRGADAEIQWESTGHLSVQLFDASGQVALAGRHVRVDIPKEGLVELDARAFGATRPHLLDDIRRRPGVRGAVGAEGRGVAMMRPGRRAAQIGPLVAPDDRTAVALLEEVLRGGRGAVIIDVPKTRTAFGEALEARGFSRRRSFLRMARGGPPEPVGPGLLYASTGAEYG